MRLLSRLLTLLLAVQLWPPVAARAADPAPLPNDRLRHLVASFKQDARGPFQIVRWFCPDGSVLPARERCKEPGGIQHAVPKDSVQQLRDVYHLYLGQILAGTPFADFLDRENGYTRLKQYQLEKYLQTADNGWIMRKARYYRGAVQAEDEEQWGSGFFRYLLGDERFWVEKFFLLREAVRDVPHWGGQSDRWSEIRVDAKQLAVLAPAFEDLRVKLHGQPDRDDAARVEAFLEGQRQEMAPEAVRLAEKLLAELRVALAEGQFAALAEYGDKMAEESPIRSLLHQLTAYDEKGNGSLNLRQLRLLADLVWLCRREMANTLWPVRRMILLDLSIAAEQSLFYAAGNWQPTTLGELFEKFYLLARASAGAGYLELWEWQEAEPLLRPFADGPATVSALLDAGAECRRVLDWGTAMVGAEYGPTVRLFAGFEPLANGFVDDRIRSSVLLPLGETGHRIETCLALLSGGKTLVFDLDGKAEVHGTNAGVAVGPFRFVEHPKAGTLYEAGSIYAIAHPPVDLTPVAGLLTIDDGNLVSHLRLLARNLGIPCSTVARLKFDALKAYEGNRIFYAVSPGGRVVLKSAARMSAEEATLLQAKGRTMEKRRIPADKLDLSRTDILDLREMRSADSGRLCGPKAANLGELKSLFPDRVAGGLVIPFGIFRRHLEQAMPGEKVSYWQYLQQTFEGGAVAGEKAESRILARLRHLREAIGKMELLPEFVRALEERFQTVLGRPLGELGVFIRSDTNMEDLKDFNGAGLNLTEFNVVGRQLLLRGIRDVWASPYAERSYLWRQKFMANPLDIYLSILLLPSVPVDKSGVLLTAGIESGGADDCTIAFSRGAGGAVEGQAAESYLLRADGTHLLLRPARQLDYKALPPTGGVEKREATLETSILNDAELEKIGELTRAIREKLATDNSLGKGPYDVELGFVGEKLWLFQVRPFVENRWARTSAYLRGLDAVAAPEKVVKPSFPLDAAENK